ncbi:hypothetical protein [Nocardia sp. NPDC057030]|uniref:hypothetical protein n=1 Tax=unclassified Nocardia TaxID=2637762 RepID=UPI00363DF86F
MLDYLILNTDRDFNYSTGVAYDNALSFHEGPVVIRSESVHYYRGRALSEGMMNSLNAVDIKRLRAGLYEVGAGVLDESEVGLPKKVVDGVIDRLRELKKLGCIPYY